MATTRYYGTGRRKSSVARVYLVPGTGKVTINKKDMDEYFGYDTLKVIARQPLELTSTADKFDVLVNVHGADTQDRLVLSDTVLLEHYLKLTQNSVQH